LWLLKRQAYAVESRTFSAFHTTTRSKGSSLVLPYNAPLRGK
jgi:hypothetical protein